MTFLLVTQTQRFDFLHRAKALTDVISFSRTISESLSKSHTCSLLCLLNVTKYLRHVARLGGKQRSERRVYERTEDEEQRGSELDGGLT